MSHSPERVFGLGAFLHQDISRPVVDPDVCRTVPKALLMGLAFGNGPGQGAVVAVEQIDVFFAHGFRGFGQDKGNESRAQRRGENEVFL